MAARAAAAEQTDNGHKLVSLSELLAQPLPYEDVPVPGYDATIRLYAVSGVERQRLSAISRAESDDKIDFQHELIAAALGAGTKPDDVAKLPSEVIDTLSEVALRMAGIKSNAVDEKADELKATASADSGSS